ncbi:MAG: N-6 DNA methylase [Rickettsiales bacterium]|nr:N-6 DNA methylase [Rickettsiales bacterium]
MSDINKVKNDLWEAANKLRAESNLKTAEFSVPVLGLIFLRYADFKFSEAKQKFDTELKNLSERRRASFSELSWFHDKGILYLKEEARFSYLLNLPESEDLGKKLQDAMSSIEQDNLSLKDVLPKNFGRIEKKLLFALMKIFSKMKIEDVEGDAFGKIYEYFLGKFASSEGQRGGEFFTPTSIVRLIVEVLKPINGSLFDPACGSGGMFVQSAEFIKRRHEIPNDKISIHGQEKTEETVKLCKMNLAVHGLEGDIKLGNTFYDDEHKSVGKFDFVMANPPFNVSGIDKERIKGDKRYCLGIPKVDNANYLWIQDFYTSLNDNGRAGFVMANSASDARQSEQDIRAKIVQAGAVDVMISVGSNFFHNVTLPCTLWFFDKGKIKTERKNKTLFLDVREIYNQIDRAHREFTESQIEHVANIVKLYRDDEPTFEFCDKKAFEAQFPKLKYRDIAGLCKVATIEEIEAQNYSLNAGRYVGTTEAIAQDYVFEERLKELNDELVKLNSESRDLETKITHNINQLLKNL